MVYTEIEISIRPTYEIFIYFGHHVSFLTKYDSARYLVLRKYGGTIKCRIYILPLGLIILVIPYVAELLRYNFTSTRLQDKGLQT